MPTTKLLLQETIKNVGRVGDIVEVSPGYARNYLIPRGLAVQPTPNNVKKVEARRKEIERHGARTPRAAGADDRAACRPSRFTSSAVPTSRATCSARSPPRTWPRRLQARASTSSGRHQSAGPTRSHRHLYRAGEICRGPGDRHQGLGQRRRREQGRHRSRPQGQGRPPAAEQSREFANADFNSPSVDGLVKNLSRAKPWLRGDRIFCLTTTHHAKRGASFSRRLVRRRDRSRLANARDGRRTIKESSHLRATWVSMRLRPLCLRASVVNPLLLFPLVSEC